MRRWSSRNTGSSTYQSSPSRKMALPAFWWNDGGVRLGPRLGRRAMRRRLHARVDRAHLGIMTIGHQRGAADLGDGARGGGSNGGKVTGGGGTHWPASPQLSPASVVAPSIPVVSPALVESEPAVLASEPAIPPAARRGCHVPPRSPARARRGRPTALVRPEASPRRTTSPRQICY